MTFLLIYTISSCGNQSHIPDVDPLEEEVEIHRFDLALFALDTNDLTAGYDKLLNDYGPMTEVFTEQIIRAGTTANPQLKRFKGLISDSNMVALHNDIAEKYQDTKWLQKGFSDAFAYYKSFYPLDTIPEVYTTITAFSVSAFTYKHIIGISLDRYLGSTYRQYPIEVMPMYMQRRTDGEYILPQSIKTLYMKKYEEMEYADATLLSKMIWAGKSLVFTKMMLPTIDDSLLLEYPNIKLKWCAGNEMNIYQHFIDKDLFYSTDQQKISRYLSDGPYTIAEGIPNESAPRLGEWLGYQIVKHYIENNPNVPLVELLENKDYKQIFQGARYKP